MSKTPRRRGLSKTRLEGTLKDAFSQLIEACGGTVRAGDLLGVSQSQAQRYSDPAYPTAELKPSQIRVLERACGQPIVTTFLAAEIGCAVIQLTTENRRPLGVDVARFGERASALFARYAKTLEDGKITQRELAGLSGEGLKVLSAVASMMADIQAMMNEET